MLVNLPQEIFDIIVGDLDLDTIGKLKRCSKKLHALLSHIPTMHEYQKMEQEVWIHAQDYAKLWTEEIDWYDEEERESEEFDKACNVFKYFRMYVDEVPTWNELKFYNQKVKAIMPYMIFQ